MTRAVSINDYGGPEVLRPVNVPLASPRTGELRVRQTAVGVNYHDVYVRSGLYRTLALPGIPGIEAVGVVEAVGEGVADFSPGDRIGYVDSAYGAYTDARNLAAGRAVRLPAGLTDAQWAAVFMKGLTVCMLLRRVRRVTAGDFVLVHAAAGGVGQLLCRWASELGATVIGTVGSAAKAALARAAGAGHVIDYREEDVPARVHALTGGDGVAVAYDSVGRNTFAGSMASLAFCGQLVLFGQASGPVEPFAPALLAARSLSVSRPIIFHYLRTPEKLREMAGETFAAFASGALRPIDPIELPLEAVAEAHRLLEERRSPGGVVLVP